jgi:hypothetical protein
VLEKTATPKQAPIKQDLLKKLNALQSSIYMQKSQLFADYDAAISALAGLIAFVSRDMERTVNQDTLNLVQSVISRYEKLVSK